MIRRTIAVITLLFLLITPIASAEMTVEDLLKSKHLSQSERDAVAKVLRNSEIIPTSPAELQKWQELGDAFAVTIKNIAHSLNVEVNTFLKSDVGMLTAGVIVYKMMGKDILRIILYTGSGLMFTFIIGFSLLIFHKGKKVVQIDGDKKTTEYIDRFEWEDTIVKNVSLILHLVIWALAIAFLTGNII